MWRLGRGGCGNTYPPKDNCGVGALVNINGQRSHQLIEDGLRMLVNLDHRGARGAEERVGDGAGMLLQKPHRFLRHEFPGLPPFDDYGIGQFFLPRRVRHCEKIKSLIDACATQEGLQLLGWRDVPTDNSGLGTIARDSAPRVAQCFVSPRTALSVDELDVKLYILRCQIEIAVEQAQLMGAGAELFYVCTLDRRKIVYKGMLTCEQLRTYYPDLSDPRVETALLLVHSRFSTNTLGAWNLAHPYRTLVHNGEFNTLRGNVNWMRTRESTLAHTRFGNRIDRVKPVLPVAGESDSADFDRVAELLLQAGRSLPHVLRMLIPQAWTHDREMPAERRAFYEFHSTLMEPWEGPALVVASDGNAVAAVLDRNGLRPCRYCVTKTGQLIMASEAGTLDTPVEQIEFQSRLPPGEIFLVDTQQRRIVPQDEIFAELSDAAPYAQWLRKYRLRLGDIDPPATPSKACDTTTAPLHTLQRTFGYTREALRVLIAPMAEDEKDPLGAMGNDCPPAVLCSGHKPLFNYFHQQFAQVSNPPLDYIREALITSLESHVGHQRNLLDQTPEHCRQLFLDAPILEDTDFLKIKAIQLNDHPTACVDITYAPGTDMAQAIEETRRATATAIAAGSEIILLSDQTTGPHRIPIPSLLATSAVHQFLVAEGLRPRVGLVVAAGDACLVHHFCTLIGFGADAVYPWLAYRSLVHLCQSGLLSLEGAVACQRFQRAVADGLLKVMAKMGISTLESYKGAQIFEAIGLSRELINTYFSGTDMHIPGLELADIQRQVETEHRLAHSAPIIASTPLPDGGDHYWRREGEHHEWNPVTIGRLQHAVRTNDARSYQRFADQVNQVGEHATTLRGLLEFDLALSTPVSLDQVEPTEIIMRRFSTGSMSFGALSREAHEALAIAMNLTGGKSGSGEGGEQVERYGTQAGNSMKQVASGRFGVTANYLATAQQIEIKMAQGSKPGEGGELPSGKVDEEIARVRCTVPGVGLISPPPHHDIYSIEDLAQLIHDLKCANQEAEIHVKLVAKSNVGIIAAGVAKARADAVLISGDAGGTGAALKTSIKHAGCPWELGLAETHQVLMANNLRSRIRVRVDGGLKTGRDVAIAALLGAEEYGFGTAPVVALGCIMLRKCHCNTCSVGIATQDPRLRAKFEGRPEHIVNYLRFVAEELRGYMAQLGFRTVDDMIGRVDRLKQTQIPHTRGINLDLTELLLRPHSRDTPRKVREQNHDLAGKIDYQFIRKAAPALADGHDVHLQAQITNRDRTVGTLLSGVVTKCFAPHKLPPDSIHIDLTGSAGQSFGAFLASGISLHLAGEANDFAGKGLSGGRICIRIPDKAQYRAQDNIIVGNVVLYGATSGEAYFNGIAGERFCVRNSGALSVVEGVGHHGCEYMTGGVVVILGDVGRNFAAGMSGGEAYVLDESGDLKHRLNPTMVTATPLQTTYDQALVRRLVENHFSYTGSPRARNVLDQWDWAVENFIKVIPLAYAEVVAAQLAQGQDIRPDLPLPAEALHG
jgi:glutamate synthase domain-containing protein 2/glutamate synthase domain-containing protein 1/glutamate synthase domain-containing protein 3